MNGIHSLGSAFLGYNLMVLFQDEKEKYKATVGVHNFLSSLKAIMTGCLSIGQSAWLAGWILPPVHRLFKQ